MSVLRRRDFKPKSLKRQDKKERKKKKKKKKAEVTDIPLLIRKYCTIKNEKGKSQTGH